ncbi:DUF262 domain-containing protein [Moraxella pluranimalium]|uniref:DUF262 domain-containing protein n=1 Tax=Moraxella pluranimalium TaxID=470453 RepID=A0A1T0CQW0_9GAMM|nr:DUF262 domain-containing protein [Moraxella pluranimalium]OOS24726.1 hypothetical protein B0680_04715 [Moraxella pluranimalium]
MTKPQTKNDIARLSIKELFEAQDKYIIPIYQRNYAWTDTEVGQLIDDIHRHTQGQYYLGSLTVKKRTDGAFEVIDGQQRLTTLFLLLSVLEHKFNLNLSFEHRETSTNELSTIKQNGELTDTNDSQIAATYHYLKSGSKKLFGGDADQQAFLKKLLTKVQIIRTEIPENTDLNQYFERMNNRGEQLEHHEVIKAKLMSKLSNDKDDQAVFSAIWNACSDMSRYAVSSFSSDEQQALFGDDVNNEHKGEYFKLYKNFKKIKESFPNVQKPKTDDDNPKTLEGILNSSNDIASTKESADNKKERFTSIIDFPNFLAQVLYLFLKDKDKDKDKIKDDIHRLDDGNLIEQFEQSGLFDDAKEIKAFAVHLLAVRVLFDRHVIKHDGSDDNADWRIYQFKKSDNNNSNNDANVFGEAENKQIKMLQTMFHYSFPAKNYKYWLFGYLKWLNDKYKSELENHQEKGCAPRLSADKHINFLEKLCDRFYFNRFYNNGKGNEYFDIIDSNESKIDSNESKEKEIDRDGSGFLNRGTAVENFIFNRLDYILWRKIVIENTEIEVLLNKNNEIDGDFVKILKGEDGSKKNFIKNFKFTARNSVEHYYPQNPSDINPKLADKDVDHFGNLCLITHSQNSSLSNRMPYNKKQDYLKFTHRSVSIKQMLMMTYKNWGKEEIEKHGKDMIDLLNQEISTT